MFIRRAGNKPNKFIVKPKLTVHGYENYDELAYFIFYEEHSEIEQLNTQLEIPLAELPCNVTDYC